MEQKQHKERLNYIIDDSPENPIFVGQTVNCNRIICQGNNLDDLKHKMKAMVNVHCKMYQEIMKQDEPFDCVELSPEQWKTKDDNIPYYEIQRTMRLLQKTEVAEKWRTIIWNVLKDYTKQNELFEVSNVILYALTNQSPEDYRELKNEKI